MHVFCLRMRFISGLTVAAAGQRPAPKLLIPAVCHDSGLFGAVTDPLPGNDSLPAIHFQRHLNFLAGDRTV